MNHELTGETLNQVLKLGWDHSRDAMVVADAESGLLVECNSALELVTGYTRSQIIGMPFFTLHPEEERAESQAIFRQAMGRVGLFEGFHLLCRDGRRIPVTVSSTAPFHAGGRLLSVGMFRDVSDLKERERRLEIQHWALQAYAEAALALARAQSTAGLMQAICEAITRDARFMLAWVGFADEDEGKMIRTAGAAGSSLRYLDGLEISWAPDRISGQGPTGFAIRTDTTQILEDIETVESFKPWRERARAAGIRSSIAIPFHVNHHRRGALMVYSSLPRAFEPVVIEAFTHFAAELGHGLHAFEQEERLNDERLQREHAQEELSAALSSVVGAITTALEMRDTYTVGHQNRVAAIACAIAKELGWPDDRLEAMRVAALVHDIGKISIPVQVLTKRAPMTKAEWTMVREHAETGYRILKDVPFNWPIAESVRQHHERVDGSGYPRGLKGEDILLDARVLAVADVVEAMASSRPYRPGLGLDAALNEIERQAGTLLDADVVRICVSLFREKGFVLPGLGPS